MILVVAATEFEAALVDSESAATVVCGIGPVEAALATVDAIGELRPEAILQIGIAGAQTLATGSVVLGSESVYCDVLDPESRIPRVERVAADPGLLAIARRVLPQAIVMPIGTTGRVGGGAACEIEAMEGFGVLRASARAGVPAVELRSISNAVADRDRSQWRIDEALDALRAAVGVLVAEVSRAYA